MPDRLARLLHPAFLVALATLVVNDHVLKDAFGNALTGKLSDLAGLVVLPVLASSLVGLATRRAVWAVHAAVGLAFAAVQFVPAEAVAAVLGVRHTPDPTDLVALAILPLGVQLSLATPRPLVVVPRWRPALAHAVGLAAVGAVLATAPPRIPPDVEAVPVVSASGPEEALQLLEGRLRTIGFAVEPPVLSYGEWLEQPENASRDRVSGTALYEAYRADRIESLAAGWDGFNVSIEAGECPGLADVVAADAWLNPLWNAKGQTLSISVWADSQTQTIRSNAYDRGPRERRAQALRECLVGPLREMNRAGEPEG